MTIEYKDSKRIVGLSFTAGAEIGETSGTDATTFPIGKTGSIYRVGIKIATGSALIGETLSATKGIQFELKRTGLTGSDIVAFEIWSADGTRVLRDTYDADTKLPTTSFAYIEFKPSQTVTLAVGYRILFVADGGTTNYVDMRTNTSGTYDTTKTHLTYSSNDDGSGTPSWTDETGKDPNFKFTLADVGDVKPTSVQDNSLFVEKDTARRYWFDANPLFTDDFSSDNGTESGSIYSVSGGKLRGTSNRSSGYKYWAEDLGFTLSNTAWVVDFDIDFTSISLSTGYGAYNAIQLTDTKGTDGIGLSWIDQTTNSQFYVQKAGSNTPNFTTTISTTGGDGSGKYYVRLIRDGGTFYAKLYSNSTRTTLIEEEQISITSTGLQYFQINNFNNSPGTWNGNVSFEIDNLKVYNGVTTASGGGTWTWAEEPDTRGLFMGGYVSARDNTIDYITIATLGNATDFGNLEYVTYDLGACSSDTRAVYGGGNGGSQVDNTNTIGYVTIATPSNATDFGDLTAQRGESVPAVSNRTRGVWAGGYASGSNYNTMDYVTLDTTGNATDFGDLATAKRALGGSNNSGTRGLFAGGYSSSHQSAIDYITIATTSNTTSFGSLTSARSHLNGCSNTTRTLFAGGGSYSNTIDYVTNDTTGNASDFGDLLGTTDAVGALANATRAVFGGGSVSGTKTNVIQYVTIDTTGNTTDFGDLTLARDQLAGASGR